VWYETGPDETGPAGGAFAGLTAVDDTRLVEVPDGIEDSTAATLGVTGLAAWDALARRAALRPGETVLVLGASGAVGAFAVQPLGYWALPALSPPRAAPRGLAPRSAPPRTMSSTSKAMTPTFLRPASGQPPPTATT